MFECRHQPVVLPDPLIAALAHAYAEPHRAYHTATHIAEVLGWYDRVADDVGWEAPVDVYTAIVFHDTIYVSGAKDNEARSAAWARREGYSARTGELIELTARHGHLTPLDVDAEAARFLDCDMAILGSDPVAFAAYDAAIAREYRAVPTEAYRAGRHAFLSGLLAVPRIYLSDYFHTRLDASARTNLAAALTT